MKNELKEEIRKEIEKESIPAPFADRPDGVAIKKEKIIFEEEYNSSKIIELMKKLMNVGKNGMVEIYSCGF